MRLLNAEFDLVEKQQDMLKQFEATNEIGFGRDELLYMTAQLDVREGRYILLILLEFMFIVAFVCDCSGFECKHQ